MKVDVRVMFFLLLLAALWTGNRISAKAQAFVAPSAPEVRTDLNFKLYLPKFPLTPDGQRFDYQPEAPANSASSNFRAEKLPPPPLLKDRTSRLLLASINKKLGIRYKFYGTDDRGYDCSGFVWRVFQDVGKKFTRTRVRELWKQLPDAVGPETSKLGTLVFFKGLKHMGIVRDGNSFYHSSRSKGVVLSTFDGYWGKRVKGFRRAPGSTVGDPANAGN
jgi:cell wall-associated NlpC family hydrolase